MRKAVAKLLARTPEDVLRTQSATDLFSFLEDSVPDRDQRRIVAATLQSRIKGTFPPPALQIQYNMLVFSPLGL